MKLDKSYHISGLFQRRMNLKSKLFLFLMFAVQLVKANGDVAPDFIRSIGKIYVVAGVCLVILITLFIYLVLIDRKISRIEKRQKHE